MRRLLEFCLLGLAIGAGGCTSSAQTTSEDRPRVSRDIRTSLGGDAIRSLLSDVHVAPVAEVVVSHAQGENFLASGVYQRIVGRTVVEGVFDIEGEVVCVRGTDFRRQCRKIVPQRDGTYAFVDEMDGSTVLVTISRLQ